VLRRGDGIFAYQLAFVVDDGAMGITQVLGSRPARLDGAADPGCTGCFGQREARWAHVPLVIAASGERLSKRDKSLSLSALRKRGVDPATSCRATSPASRGSPRGMPARRARLLGVFSLPKLPLRGPTRIDALPY